MISDLRPGNNKFLNKIKPLSLRICVIYGVNGAGKDSIKNRLLDRGKFIYNIKTTTREPRGNEISGIDYHYVERDSPHFDRLRDRAIVSYSFNSNYYWDDAEEILKNLTNNPDKFLIIIMGNITGFKAFLNILPNVNRFCILPAADDVNIIKEARSRMVRRDRDDLTCINKRLSLIKNSISELKECADLVVINRRGELEKAVEEIIAYLNKYGIME